MKNKLPVLLVTILLVSGCDKMLLGKDENIIPLKENLQPPPKLEDGWEVSSMTAENIDSSSIIDLITQLQNESRNIHSLLIIKNNKLVVESYFGGWHRERLQSLRSVSKSVNSILVGISIDKNQISGVQQRIFDFFPDYADLKTPRKNEIRLQHLLTMTAGLQWNQSPNTIETYLDDEYQLRESEDGFRYVLQKEVVSDPGTKFNYSSGNSDLLAGIIHHASGMQADKFAEQYLFNPLAITKYGWVKQKNGFPNAGYGLFLMPRDMAKIGQLFLDSGQWKGNQVVSKQWVKDSGQTFIGISGEPTQGYGYQWWTQRYSIKGNTLNVVEAHGRGGEVICIVPALKAVIVLTGNNYEYPESALPFNFLKGYILPALL